MSKLSINKTTNLTKTTPWGNNMLPVFGILCSTFRQSHGKGTAFAFGAFNRDGTACQLAGGLHKSQPESVADGAV